MQQITKDTIRVTLFTVAGFAAFFYIELQYFADIRKWFEQFTGHVGLRHFLAYITVGLPVFFVLIILHGPIHWLRSVGLTRHLVRGFVIALACTLPMFVGYALVFEWNGEISWTRIIAGVICAGLFEEIYFRGFLFGQLYRYTRIGFIPAILIGAILFAIVHLSQSHDPGTLLGIFLVTFAGAILFAWVYVEWDYNLWVSIFLHMLMNLSWMLFSAGENALGGVYSNLFRFLTIALVIIGTIVYKRKKGLKIEVNRNTIWMKRLNQ